MEYVGIPYFMTNKDWYESLDEDVYIPEFDDYVGIVLTDKAPEEAIESYREFYSCMNES